MPLPKFCSCKQALYSVRQDYVSKAGFEKVAEDTVYISANCKIKRFLKVGGLWLHRNLAEHFQIIWQNSLSEGGQSIGCRICQIPEKGSRHSQTQVLQKTRMSLFERII